MGDLRAQYAASPSRLGLTRWLRSPAGAGLLRTEVERVHVAVGNLFGYHCVQVGDLAGADLLGASRIINRVVIDIDGNVPRRLYPLVNGSATSLPIDSHAVDVVVLPHVIEFESHPHEVLREALRVLVPEGHLLILGFNPISMIGLRRALKFRATTAPWCGTYFGARRIRDWLALLGFNVIDQRPCFALKHDGTHTRGSGSRALLEWMPPALASAWFMLVKKRVNAMLPVRPRWKLGPRLVGAGLARPSTRCIDDA